MLAERTYPAPAYLRCRLSADWGQTLPSLRLELTLQAWALSCCCVPAERPCILAMQAVRRLGADLQLHQRAARQATLEAERLQSLHQQLQELQAACQGSRRPGGGPGACLTEQLDNARRALPAVDCFLSQTLVAASTQQAALVCPAACHCRSSAVLSTCKRHLHLPSCCWSCLPQWHAGES